MKIDDQLITHLEDLSCLSLAAEEKLRLKDDLNKILSGMARLNELNTEKVPERSHPFDAVNAFRKDELRVSLGRARLLENAPEHSDEMFIAPLTVE